MHYFLLPLEKLHTFCRQDNVKQVMWHTLHKCIVFNDQDIHICYIASEILHESFDGKLIHCSISIHLYCSKSIDMTQ
jgi:hypothetical protein